MGGNNSRHGNGGEVLPTGIRQRIEEWRKRRSGTTLQREEGTSSNKNLLDDGKSQSSKEKESGNNNKDSPNDTQQAKQGVQKKGEFVELKTEKVESIKIKHEEVNAKHDSGDEDDEEEEDEEEDDDIKDRRLVGPGSPSFKVYCKETNSKKEESSKVYCNETKNKNEESFKIYYNGTKNKNEEEHESKALGVENIFIVHQKTPSDSSVESSASASSENSIRNSNEVVEMAPVPKRKGNKKKKFGAMRKNILHAKHLNRMNPMFSCTGNDRRRRSLVEDK